MSLKSFHLFFIIVAVLFCFGFSGWIWLSEDEAFVGSALWAASSTVGGVALTLYGVWFAVKKGKRIIL